MHGLPKGYGWVGMAPRTKDCTEGCIAVTNQEIDEIRLAVADGNEIESRPQVSQAKLASDYAGFEG